MREITLLRISELLSDFLVLGNLVEINYLILPYSEVSGIVKDLLKKFIGYIMYIFSFSVFYRKS